jgi:glycine betaine/proline transport system substrate-binding protein
LPAKAKWKLVYVEWDCAVASSNVIKAVLQEKMGYEVELTSVSAAAMWQAIASGDVDGMTTAWLPVTHGHYLERFERPAGGSGAQSGRRRNRTGGARLCDHRFH